jgi:hypothetical protein
VNAISYTKWEYLTQKWTTSYQEDADGKSRWISAQAQFEAALPQLGAQGWELAALLLSSNEAISVIFKRPQPLFGFGITGTTYVPCAVQEPESDPVAADQGQTKVD